MFAAIVFEKQFSSTRQLCGAVPPIGAMNEDRRSLHLDELSGPVNAAQNHLHVTQPPRGIELTLPVCGGCNTAVVAQPHNGLKR